MINVICDKCNCEADHLSTYELSREQIVKLSAEYNCEFENKLIKTTYICPSCADIKDFIHILK